MVTLLISSYNQKGYLVQALESVLSQTYQPFEIIISDDASTDGSQALIQQYVHKYPHKITAFYAEHNQGAIANYNFMLKQGRGGYLVKMDGDDLLLPDHIQNQMAFLIANPHLVGSYSNVEVFDSETDKTICLFVNKLRPPRKGTLDQVIKYGCFFHVPFMLLRRDQLADVSYVKNSATICDYLFMIKYLEKGGEIGYVDEILGKYRIHSTNVTQNKIQLIWDTLWAAGWVIFSYPRYTFLALFRIFDAVKANLIRRNPWL